MKITFGKIFILIFGISLVFSILINYRGISVLWFGTVPGAPVLITIDYLLNLFLVLVICVTVVGIYKILQNIQLRKIRRTPERF